MNNCEIYFGKGGGYGSIMVCHWHFCRWFNRNPFNGRRMSGSPIRSSETETDLGRSALLNQGTLLVQWATRIPKLLHFMQIQLDKRPLVVLLFG